MIEAQTLRTLADSFFGFSLIESEQARIAELAAIGGVPAHIITTYAPRTKPYQETYQKKERIPGGFRPGTAAYDKQATTRLIRYLGQPSNFNYGFFWKIYKAAFYDYVETELPQLKQLLSETTTEGRISDPKEFLILVCSNALEFGISQEQVRSFYDAFWLQRVPNFDEILPLCAKQDEGRAQKRKIAKVEAGIEESRKAQAALEAKATSILEAVQELSENFSSQQSEIASVTESLGRLEKLANSLEKMTNGQESAIHKEVAAGIAGITSRTKAIEQGLSTKVESKDFKSELKKIADEARSAASATRKELSDLIKATIAEKIAALEESMEGKLSALAKEARAVAQRHGSLPEATGYRSPLITLPAAHKSVPKIGSEADFANSWMSLLNREHGILASFEQVLAHHSLLTSSHVAIINEPVLAQSWIHCLGWDSLTLQLAASPLWASETDWKDGLNFLFQEHADIPRVVIIHNYDSALAECYLAPSLLLWALKPIDRQLTKLLLIPSDNKGPKHQIVEHAPVLSTRDFLSAKGPQVDGVRAPAEIRGNIPTGVAPSTFRSWAEQKKNIEYDLNTIQNSLGVEFSSAAIRTFSSVIQRAATSFTEASAIGLGMTSVLLPWVKAKHGEAAFSSMGEFLKQLPDVRC